MSLATPYRTRRVGGSDAAVVAWMIDVAEHDSTSGRSLDATRLQRLTAREIDEELESTLDNATRSQKKHRSNIAPLSIRLQGNF